MKIVSPVLLGLSLAVVGSSFAAAQETQSPKTQSPQMQNQQMQSMQMQGPPKVLQITREFIKPGKSGAIHDKSESKFVAGNGQSQVAHPLLRPEFTFGQVARPVPHWLSLL